MPTLRRLLIFGLYLSIMLTACSSSIPATTSPPLSPTTLPQPTLPRATLVPTPEPVSVGVPVVEYNDSTGTNKLLVISSVTGNGFDAFKPIPLGHNYSHVFAPNGHTLALVSDGELYLIDLFSWTYRT